MCNVRSRRAFLRLIVPVQPQIAQGTTFSVLTSLLPHLPLQVFPTAHHLAIVMEYASGGDLSELIDERSQQEVILKNKTFVYIS